MISERPDKFLSPSGLARRAAMKGTLTHEVKRLRNRRLQARAGLAAIVAVVASFVIWTVVVPFGRDAESHGTAAIVTDHATVEAVAPGPLLSPVAPVPIPKPIKSLRIEIVDDQRLLSLLAEAGQPSALVRIDGRTFVIPERRSRERPER